jgi:hypothetical protein
VSWPPGNSPNTLLCHPPPGFIAECVYLQKLRSVTLACHHGFYPKGKWLTGFDDGQETFIPKHISFRRGRWAMPDANVTALHSALPGAVIEPLAEGGGEHEEAAAATVSAAAEGGGKANL